MLTKALSPCAQEKKQENKEEKEEKGVKYHRVERSSSFVKRSIRMPDSADLSQIKVRALHSQEPWTVLCRIRCLWKVALAAAALGRVHNMSYIVSG